MFRKEKLDEARIYGSEGGSTFYKLTQSQKDILATLPKNKQMSFKSQIKKDALKADHRCLNCTEKFPEEKKNPDGTFPSYCDDCLQQFRDSRNRLATGRKSCRRCENPPKPGLNPHGKPYKLCQDCINELQAEIDQAKRDNLCIRCKKVPPDKNDKGRQTLFCKNCNIIKKEEERARKKKIKNWKDYAKDVDVANTERRVKNLGTQLNQNPTKI